MAGCGRQQSKLDPAPEFSDVRGNPDCTQAVVSRDEPGDLAESVQEVVVDGGCGVRQPSGCADRESWRRWDVFQGVSCVLRLRKGLC